MRFPGWFAVLVGVSMILQWSVFLAAGSVPELKTEPVRLGFHLAAEILTALLLVFSGTSLLASRRWVHPWLLVALGMLIYTSIASPGYFAQRGQTGFVVMFGAILVLAVAAVVCVLRDLYQATN